MAVDRTSPTEYGGREGLIQKQQDGHELSPKEEALMMRMLGAQSDTEYYETQEGDVGIYAGANSVLVDPHYDRTVEKLNGRTIEDLGVNQ